MCGIAGYAGFAEAGLLERMCDAIAHRGPDSGGAAEFPEHGMAIGIRRLAIIDLVSGDQPFVTADGRVTLVFNGEIYNFAEIRTALCERGHRFKTRSDTEVVLAAYLEWGMEAWKHLHGMFAIAIVDLRGEGPKLLVVRDRAGIKPLYYAAIGGRMVFASELKAVLRWPDCPAEVDVGRIRD